MICVDGLGSVIASAMGRSCAVVSLACVACGALLLLTATYQTTGGGGPRNLFQPRDGDVVAIKSWHTGMYVDVRSTDGRQIATAPKANRTLFRVMILTRPMVDMLADAMRTTNVAKWSHRKMSTKSGCKCSGFSAPPSAASSRRPPPPPSPGQSRV